MGPRGITQDEVKIEPQTTTTATTAYTLWLTCTGEFLGAFVWMAY